MTKKRRELGLWGEQVAVDHLAAHDFKILERNWRCQQGEIDIIGEDGDVLVFVEVKTRSGRHFGSPEEAITPQKARRLLDLGQRYLSFKKIYDVECRIDLVAIDADQDGNLIRCEHVPNIVWGW